MGILDTPFRLEELCQSDDKYATETSQMQVSVYALGSYSHLTQ